MIDRALELDRATPELALLADPAQEHGELLAAPARNAVHRAGSRSQAPRHLDEHAVSGAMTQRVVDLLEMV